MEIIIRKPALFPVFPEAETARSGRGRAGDTGKYHEFFSGMTFLLGDKWGDKNPLVKEFSPSRLPPDTNGGKPVKQLRAIEAGNRERMQSAIHQKEMTKWQTHP
jgi:hypothetical protein